MAMLATICVCCCTLCVLQCRVSNHYNGIYFQSTLFKDGRLGTDSLSRVCPMHSNWGVMRGNVVHSNQRFGELVGKKNGGEGGVWAGPAMIKPLVEWEVCVGMCVFVCLLGCCWR